MNFLANCGEHLALYEASHQEIREQDMNARVMPPEMFERLQSTISRDNRLESLPFGVLRDNHIELVSGHHRYRAAISAGLKSIHILVDTRDLSREEIVAKQLAHNSINGTDDLEMIDRLFSQITIPDLQLESFIHLDNIPAQGDLSVDAIINEEIKLSWPVLVIALLPTQDREIEKAIERIAKAIPKEADKVWACSDAALQGLQKALAGLSKTEDIRSNGALLARMCEIVNHYLEENRESSND